MGIVNPFDDRPARLKTKITGTYAFILAANALAWGWAVIAFADRPVLLGTASLAYIFGVRHAFDADHIAAIDNVVRKLVQDGRQPFSVGFFFSLGHSTIVVLASIAIAAMAAALHGRMEAFRVIGGVIATGISAFVLLIVAIANLFILRGVWAAFARARSGGSIVGEDLDALLAGRGMLARIFRPLFGVVSRSWHMYPIGFLFALGFDTATEIGLLGVATTSAAQGMSVWTILVFPALFTAGMSLVDTTDSVLMAGAYRWAFIRPIRKLWYNLTITAGSVAVALFIGGVEALGLIGAGLGLTGGFWDAVGGLNDNFGKLGCGVAGLFIAAWVVSLAVYRSKGYDKLQVQLGSP